MNDDLKLRIKAVSVFSAVAQKAEPLVALLSAKADGDRVECAARIFAAVTDSGCACTGEWLQRLAEGDDNAFSRAAARGEKVNDRIKAQVKSELETLKRLAEIDPAEFVTDVTRPFFPMFGCGGFDATYDRLEKFYRSNGCGVLTTSSTFIFSDGEFVPADTEPVRLCDLKNYDDEKAEIVKNTQNFIDGRPAFHALLYGDRGTGKSTTVHALGCEFGDRLKIIELNKSDLGALRAVYKKLYGLKQRFIVFIDDLSFDENDARIDDFKAALEGSLSQNKNVLIYCTSNRRHLIKEAEHEVKRNDQIQAELALFDRFGLVVTYINPDKAEFLDILKQILASRGIDWRDEYAAVAERTALRKGGRSPRAAKQVADYIEAECAADKRG